MRQTNGTSRESDKTRTHSGRGTTSIQNTHTHAHARSNLLRTHTRTLRSAKMVTWRMTPPKTQQRASLCVWSKFGTLSSQGHRHHSTHALGTEGWIGVACGTREQKRPMQGGQRRLRRRACMCVHVRVCVCVCVFVKQVQPNASTLASCGDCLTIPGSRSGYISWNGCPAPNQESD